MSLLKIAADLFISQLGAKGGNLNLETVIGALQQLLPTKGGEVDLSALISKFTGQGGGDLASLASSFLGGAAANIDVSQIIGALGKSNVDEFAGNVGVDSNTAASGLASIIPQLLQQGKEGGLLGGLAGGAAKSLLGGLFK